MWEEVLRILGIRKPQEEQPVRQSEDLSDYQIRNIKSDDYYEFWADIVYVPTGKRIDAVFGNSEEDLIRKGREQVRSYLKRQRTLGKTSLDL